MRKVVLALAAAGSLVAFAGCDETYKAVNGTDQVLVQDAGDKIDQKNIEKACEDKGQKVSRVDWVGNGKTAALVTCKDR